MLARLRHVVAVLVVCLTVVTPTAGALTQSTWRPYTNPNVLVQLGMTKGEVLLKAGEPQTTEIISLGTDGFASINVWTYIRTGHNAAVTTLTFKGSRLVNINTEIVH